MAHTRHGHHIPGTTMDREEKLMSRARCGGPQGGYCVQCTHDASKVVASTDIRKDLQLLIEELERAIADDLVYTPQTQIDKLKLILERSN